MMDTPICDFVREYAERECLRLHMPGHKGERGLLGLFDSDDAFCNSAFCGVGVERFDITEIDGADVLYGVDACEASEKGIIRKSEDNAAALFGTRSTVYSCEGSSLAIRAMLFLCMSYARAQQRGCRDGRPLVAAGRNAHKVFMTAAALLDIDVEWIYGSEGFLSCNITAKALEEWLLKASEKNSLPIAVYVTSPDYLGNITDIRALSAVCHRFDVLLLVDNAHGAYLNFLPESLHPMALGADLCCDSAHKTLPVLTGGAYLHISASAPAFFTRELAANAASVFASTSPSYLILQSLDAANKYLSSGYREKLASFTEQISRIRSALTAHGYTVIGNEPLKLTIAPKSYGYTGAELASMLSEHGIICEFYDNDYMVMMFTPELSVGTADVVREVLLSIPQRRTAVSDEHLAPPPCPRLVAATSIREAMLAPSELLPVSECLGRVLALASVSCPPAIPIAVCGEVLDEEAIRCFEYYGVERCRVVKV